MEDVAIIFVLTLATVNTCGAIYIGKSIIKLICKAVHYQNLLEREEQQQ